MLEIENINKERGFDRHRRIVINSHHKKPGEIKQNEVHVYNRNGEIFLRMFDTNHMLLDIKAEGLSEAEIKSFKTLLNGNRNKKPSDDKVICRIANCNTAWSDEDFKVWRDKLNTIDDSNIADVIAVLSYAYHITVAEEKFFIREQQILAVLLLFNSTNGLAIQLETGGGKSLVIAIFNAIEALRGLKGHTITANGELAERDVDNHRSFADKLNISIDHNIGGVAGTTFKPCYSADRVHCDMRHLLEDNLRNLFDHVMDTSDVDTITLDECDAFFIDQAIFRGTKIQLSGPIPGFEYLKPALQLIWTNLYNIRHMPSVAGYEYNKTEHKWVSSNAEFPALTDERMHDWIRDSVASAVSDILDSPALPVPVHLAGFIKDHTKRWVESGLKALMYEKGANYIIYEDKSQEKPRKTITAINIDNGEIHTNLVLSDGLTQILQIKESLAQTPESLTYIFFPYHSYLLKHRGKIFGLTGTIGATWHQKFIHDVYGVPSIILPTFMESKLVERDMIIAKNKKDWLDKIVKDTKAASDESRATLIIAETINEVTLIVQALKQSGYKGTIYEYYDGKKQKHVVNRRIMPGEVIVATNAIGRGTDIQIWRLIERHGGLNLILTWFAESLRAYLQILGRVARNGERGTSIAIIDPEKYTDLITKCGHDVKCFNRVRDENEISKLNEQFVCNIPGKNLESWLFQEYVHHLRINASPTGFELVTLRGDITDLDSKKQTNSQLYLYSKKQTSLYSEKGWLTRDTRIYLKPPGKAAQIDITDSLSQIDPKMFDHIKTVLSRTGMTLNGRAYELIHFIAAYNGLSKNPDIVLRVIAAYEAYG
jgi:preprotein translocase subunit SecA